MSSSKIFEAGQKQYYCHFHGGMACAERSLGFGRRRRRKTATGDLAVVSTWLSSQLCWQRYIWAVVTDEANCLYNSWGHLLVAPINNFCRNYVNKYYSKLNFPREKYGEMRLANVFPYEIRSVLYRYLIRPGYLGRKFEIHNQISKNQHGEK